MEQPSEVRLCECHGKAMYWNKDARKRLGGFYRCSVESKAYRKRWRAAKYAADASWRERQREYNRRSYHKKMGDPEWLEGERRRNRERMLAKYDSDFIWRNESLMKSRSRRRRQSIERQREALRSETIGGLTTG